MQILLDIKDSKVNIFLKFLSDLPYVKAKPLNKKKEKFFRELLEAIEDVKLHKQGKLKLKSADELLNEL